MPWWFENEDFCRYPSEVLLEKGGGGRIEEGVVGA